jgi:lysophospholipase L1-like esterase
MAEYLRNGDIILFAGDSITDQGRRTRAVPLGQGFVKIFSELVTADYLDWQVTYLNKGVLGNRIYDLKNRWRDDVLDQNFDWLCLMIGINDVAGCLREDPLSSDPLRFGETLDELLGQVSLENPHQMVLMDPFYLSRDHGGISMRSRFLKLLPGYLEAIHQLSEKYGTRLIATHDIFQRHLEYREVDYFATEPVHPSRTGHLMIAHALFRDLLPPLSEAKRI